MAKTEMELLQEISEKQNTSLAEVKEVKADAANAKKQAEDLTAQVLALNTELKAKDATIGDIQNEVKELKAKGGRMKGATGKEIITLDNLIADTLVEHKEAFGLVTGKGANYAVEGIGKGKEVKTVANIASANLSGTGNNYISYLDWQPGMEPTGQMRFRNLFRTIQSETDFVRFPRANSPIGEGSFGRQTEAAAKVQIDRDYTMIDLTLKPMAGYAIVSRQSLRNIVFLQSWLPTSMMEQLMDAEDVDFANTLIAAAAGSTSTTGFTNSTSNIDKLIIYVTNTMTAKYRPNFIAVPPAVWGNIIGNKETNAGYNIPGVLSVTADGQVRLLGIPVYPVNWLTSTRVLLGDSTRGAIVQSEGLTLRQSDSHSTIFTTNEVAFLIERTEGFATFRTDAFITAVL